MSKLNFDRPIFKILKIRERTTNQVLTDITHTPIDAVYQCDGSCNSWKSFGYLILYVFHPLQHAFMYGDLSVFPKTAMRLPEGSNENQYLLLCNVLMQSREFRKAKGKVYYHKLDKKLLWNLDAIDGLVCAIKEVVGKEPEQLEIDTKFVTKFEKLKKKICHKSHTSIEK